MRISILSRFPPVCDNLLHPRTESRPTRGKTRKKTPLPLRQERQQKSKIGNHSMALYSPLATS